MIMVRDSYKIVKPIPIQSKIRKTIQLWNEVIDGLRKTYNINEIRYARKMQECLGHNLTTNAASSSNPIDREGKTVQQQLKKY